MKKKAVKSRKRHKKEEKNRKKLKYTTNPTSISVGGRVEELRGHAGGVVWVDGSRGAREGA